MPTATILPPASFCLPGSGRKAVPSVFLPKEHGSWSLALEPLALGLLVAPSGAGGAFAVAAVAGFFVRRPLKALATPALTRRQGSGLAVGVFSVIAAVALAIVLVLGGLTPLWPLLAAAPLAALFVWFDAQNGSRAAAAEVAGSAAFAIMPAVMASLAGWSAPAALALAGLALTRSVPTVLTVRCSLRRAKGEPGRFSVPVLATGLGACAVTWCGELRFAPIWTALPAWILFARTCWFASSWHPLWRARQVGMAEAFLGLLYVGAIAAAYGP